jgi:hypothetical protein
MGTRALGIREVALARCDVFSEMFQTDNINVTEHDDSGEAFDMTGTPTYTENVISIIFQ